MKATPNTNFSRQISKVLWITLAWTIVSIFQFFNGYAILHSVKFDFKLINPEVYFMGSLVTGILAGIIGGSVLVFVWEKSLRNKNYGAALFQLFWTYILTYLMVSLGTNFYYYLSNTLIEFSDMGFFAFSFSEMFHLASLHSFVFWLIIVLVTLVVLQVNDKYGPGVFPSFLLGRYFRPKREERIFMFLDLRSSTTIAEKLGEVRYFNFIKDVFTHATPAILNAKGEIYQYVGDEIVVSWRMKNGIKNGNCIQCFFDVQSAMKKHMKHYNENYSGNIPVFKAGLHYGHVMAGEVGTVKRDIAFSGDVLNTASRIQSKCNDLGVNILVSKILLDKLSKSLSRFKPQKLGDMLLRGKQQKVLLYTV